MSERQRGDDADSNKRRRDGGVEPYPFSKRRMLSIKDVPILVAEEETEILAITGRSGGEINQIIIQCKQDERGKNYEVGNGVCVCVAVKIKCAHRMKEG